MKFNKQQYTLGPRESMRYGVSFNDQDVGAIYIQGDPHTPDVELIASDPGKLRTPGNLERRSNNQAA